MALPAPPIEIVVLGDLHGHYDDEDVRFLERRKPALCVFVGDLGDEDPVITARIDRLRIPFRVLLGNHDAWESFRHNHITDALQRSLDILGPNHLAYTHFDLDEAGVSLIGGRPFSWGGPSLRSPEVYDELYGVRSHEDSAARIVEAARAARYEDLVIIGHNGPRGLGSRPFDIYGKDFGKPGGDWGDLDLRIALRILRDEGFRVSTVIAGHMHHRLAFPRGEVRRRCVIKPDTVYVNPARVPRIFKSQAGQTVRHYVSVRFGNGQLLGVDELHVTASGCEVVPLHTREAAAE